MLPFAIQHVQCVHGAIMAYGMYCFTFAVLSSWVLILAHDMYATYDNFNFKLWFSSNSISL